MKRLIAAVAIIVVLVIWFVFNPFKKSEDSNDGPTKRSTAVTQRGNLTIAINSTGVIEPTLTVELKSKASGEIIELPIEEGDMVKKGQLIARLDQTTAKNDFDQSQADLEVARVALSQATEQTQRQKQLYDRGLISELDYENSILAKERANSDLVRATTALEYAKERLSDTIIKSPIDGIVLTKFVEKGQIIASGISAVTGGTTIATVADMSRAYVRTSVDEVDIGQVALNQKATVIAETYPDREFRGEVLRIHPLAKVEQNVTTFDVTIEVDNSDGLLMAGMNASVEVVAGFRENVLLVPREALTDARSIARMVGFNPAGAGAGQRNDTSRPEGGRPSGGPPPGMMAEGSSNPKRMVIVIANGQEEPRDVEIGLSNFEKAEILSGLDEGDTVLTTVTSKALQDREAFLERIREHSQIPGMGR
ncbi:MAG: efflux RND transporter periplasmic adaptor subunit [Candidatus Zixiibacteriota bacterium]